MDTNWIVPLITGITGVLGALGGQLISTGRQQMLEERKWRWKIDEEDKKIEREENEKRFQAYNSILKQEGENSPIIISLPNEYLKIPKYQENIRSVLFENLHLMDEDIRRRVHELDDIIVQIEFQAEWQGDPDSALLDKAHSRYNELIRSIREKYE